MVVHFHGSLNVGNLTEPSQTLTEEPDTALRAHTAPYLTVLVDLATLKQSLRFEAGYYH